MRRYLILILIITFLGLTIYSAVSASSAQQQFNQSLDKAAVGTGHAQTPLSKQTPAQLIGTIIKAILGLIGVLFLGMMIYGGYIWMLARGNEQEVARAQSSIQNAIIGLVIVLAAYAITHFIGTYINTY